MQWRVPLPLPLLLSNVLDSGWEDICIQKLFDSWSDRYWFVRQEGLRYIFDRILFSNKYYRNTCTAYSFLVLFLSTPLGARIVQKVRPSISIAPQRYKRVEMFAIQIICSMFRQTFAWFVQFSPSSHICGNMIQVKMILTFVLLVSFVGVSQEWSISCKSQFCSPLAQGACASKIIFCVCMCVRACVRGCVRT